MKLGGNRIFQITPSIVNSFSKKKKKRLPIESLLLDQPYFKISKKIVLYYNTEKVL